MKTVQQFKFITFNYIVYYTFPYFLIILILYRLAKEFSNKSLGLDDLMSSSSVQFSHSVMSDSLRVEDLGDSL